MRYELTLVFALIILVLSMPAMAQNIGQNIQNLKSENSAARIEAAMTLGELNDTHAVEPLIQSLDDDNSSVRAEAAKALGWIKDNRAVDL